MIPFNLHTHSVFCDGSDHPEAYVQQALIEGLHTLGFSSHAPVPFSNHFAIQGKEKLVEYTETIRSLQEEYKGRINIFLGLEIDYIPGLMPDFKVYNDACHLDYTIGSIHLVKKEDEQKLWFIDGPKSEVYEQGLMDSFNNDIQLAVRTYWNQLNSMIETQEFDIIGHFDKIKMHNRGRFFNEEESWYRRLVFETLDHIKEKGLIVEINTRGLYKQRSEDYFPGKWIVRELKKMKVPLTLCSDAHKPEELAGYYIRAERMLKELGINSLMVLTQDGWREEAF